MTVERLGVPIIDLQRRLMEAGRIRAGDRSDKGAPRKLAEWRLTSKDKQRLQAAAELWGGTVQVWNGRDGEWELYTNTDQLPIMLIPGSTPTTWYELWSKGGCQRRCDGQHEIISDSPCLCGDDERECKPTTRLSVLLPDIPGVGSWLLSSTGWNAAAELAGAAELLGKASAQGVLIPARLRLEQRVDVKAGQTRRYAVPVIDVDVSFRDLLGGGTPGALAPGDRPVVMGIVNLATYTPLAAVAPGPSLGEALEEVETRQITRTGRSAAPFPDVETTFTTAPTPADDVRFGEGPPSVIEGQEALPVEEPAPARKPTRRMNTLVGKFRAAGHDPTAFLWEFVASHRLVDPAALIDELGGRDAEGTLHWSPLRDSLTVEESLLVVRELEKFEAVIEGRT